MEKSGQSSHTGESSTPLHSISSLLSHRCPRSRKGRGGHAGRDRRRRQSEQRSTGTSEKHPRRPEIITSVSLGPCMGTCACACACASCLGKLSRLSSGRIRQHARGNTGTFGLCRAARRRDLRETGGIEKTCKPVCMAQGMRPRAKTSISVAYQYMTRRPAGFQSRHENCMRTYRTKRRDVCSGGYGCHGKVTHNAPVPRLSRNVRRCSS